MLQISGGGMGGINRAGAHLSIVRRRNAVHETGDLGAQVGDGDELLEHVLGQHVRVPRVPSRLAVHVDVVHPQVQVGGADGAHLQEEKPFLCGEG